MIQFQGFPDTGKVEYAAIPKTFFSGLLPQITDMAELKTTLCLIAGLSVKKGFPRYIAFSELLQDVNLVAGLKILGGQPEQLLRSALKLAVDRGTVIAIPVTHDGRAEDIYLLNTEINRQAAAKIKSGEIKLKGFKAAELPPVTAEPLPDIYTLYEQNIGMLTPIIAEELKDAEKMYPANWIRDAIKEAVLHNKRSIKYVIKILENWSAEGRGDGTYQRDIKKTDPDKYIKGKYGHMVRR